MRKLTDEELQKIVEESLIQQNRADISEENRGDFKMYSLLFEELNTQTLNSLPDDFADEVINKINNKNALENALKFYGLISFLVLLFLCVTIGTFAYAEVPYLNNIFAIMNKFKNATIFGLFCLILIQICDQLLVKSRRSRYNH